LKEQNINLKNEFDKDYKRVEKFSLKHQNIYFDYSKNLINYYILKSLLESAEKSSLKDKIKQMFNVAKINSTEHRAVLHTALRDL
ncbi:glucose-6-phosphate isomerase, partial [Francisella tularensis subsp. holarctica]|nr:glucose-6-phosphate isomerase [Francisella tularensis subsp. holarctica]